MVKILNLEDGIQEIFKAVDEIRERPILIAIYGWPNSGKSYLMKRIGRECFDKKGFSVVFYEGVPYGDIFKDIQRVPRFDLYFFHCAWLRENSDVYEEIYDHEDPNILSRRILGKNIHLNVVINNPNLVPIEWKDPSSNADVYDFIILNPDSKIKEF
jgi:hypothetical protein